MGELLIHSTRNGHNKGRLTFECNGLIILRAVGEILVHADEAVWIESPAQIVEAVELVENVELDQIPRRIIQVGDRRFEEL